MSQLIIIFSTPKQNIGYLQSELVLAGLKFQVAIPRHHKDAYVTDSYFFKFLFGLISDNDFDFYI